MTFATASHHRPFCLVKIDLTFTTPFSHRNAAMKPFKAPTVVRRTPSNSQQPVVLAEPPAKKRRINHENEDDKIESINAAANILKQPKPVPKFQSPATRKPLAVVENPSSSLSSGPEEKHHAEGYYAVLW